MLLIRNTNLFEKLKNADDIEAKTIINKDYRVQQFADIVDRKKKSITFLKRSHSAHFTDTPVLKVMPELKNKSKKTEKLMGVLRCTKEKLTAIENKAKSENITITELLNRALDKYCGLD